MIQAKVSTESRAKLHSLAQRDRQEGIRRKFELDQDRASKFSFELAELYIDFSKTHISADFMHSYCAVAEEIRFTSQRDEFFSGAKVNSTEQRPALHMLLRDHHAGAKGLVDEAYLRQAELSFSQLREQYAALSGKMEQRSAPVKDIIHVGIGGSSLGPQLLYEAMADPADPRRVHFVSNIDGHQLQAVLAQCSVETTLVVGVSKTFGTAETLQNLDTIGAWFMRNGVADYRENYIAVTAQPDRAVEYGIAEANVVNFPQWVGGRYSVWSPVSLSAILLTGMQAFEQFLAGAAVVDQHFMQSEPGHNICFIAAALDHYYHNYLAAGTRAVFAYDYRLRSLVAYLQQLETESNGKDRQRDGLPVDQLTSPVVWGGVGTDVQHSVFQMLHQGTSLIPAEFLLVQAPDHQWPGHHRELLANGLAQTAALLAGQDDAQVDEHHAGENLPEIVKLAKLFSGNRPSTTVLMERLSPHSLGALLAFYEHRTYCGGVLCNINSFDQMGVELGKRLAKQVRPLLAEVTDDSGNRAALDPSTRALLRRLINRR